MWMTWNSLGVFFLSDYENQMVQAILRLEICLKVGNTCSSVSVLVVPSSTLLAKQKKLDLNKVNLCIYAFFWVSHPDCLDIDNKNDF